MPTSAYIYTNCMHDLLLVVLQDETFIYYLSESLTCLKFILWKLNICLLKGYLMQNSSSFVFVYVISSIKSDIFWVKNTFVFKEIFVANLILHFHSLWFFFYKKIPLFHVLWFLIWKLMAHHCMCDSKQSHAYYRPWWSQAISIKA